MQTRHESPLLPILYGVGAMLIISPLLEVLLRIWPFKPAALAWRFGAMGTVGNSLLWPVIGTVVLALVADWLKHPRVLRVVALGSLFAALLLLSLLGLFTLDAVQLRAEVNPGVAAEYDLSTGKIVIGYLLAIGMEMWLARNALRAARGAGRARQEAAPATRRSSVLIPD